MPLPTPVSLPVVSRQPHAASHAAWLGARASNVRRRAGRLVAAALLSFGSIVGLYVLLPSVAVEVPGFLTSKPAPTDTTELLSVRTRADSALRAADSVLESQRMALQLIEDNQRQTQDSLNAVVPTTYGDSLLLLERLIARAESAPLLASYEALGRAPFMRDDARARALVDSVVQLSVQRESLQTRASGDSIFVSLTTQLNELGRSLRTVAQVRARALRAATPSAIGDLLEEPARVDTTSAWRARQAAQSALTRADGALSSARARAHAADSLRAFRTATQQRPSLTVLILAAALLSATIAFLSVLALEIRHPRLADAAEAERETGQRVIGQLSQNRPQPGRRRRATDMDVSPVLNPAGEDYRMFCGFIASQWPREGIVTITGDRPPVVAAVAANVAAVLAIEAHSTLLVDEDFLVEPVRRVLGLRRVSGLAATLENRRRWAESLVTVPIGRGRVLEVLPSGHRDRELGAAELQALVGEVQRAARRYDATVVVAPGPYALRARAGDDVVICAVRGVTPLRGLVALVNALIEGGAKVRGLVVWEGTTPTMQGN